MYRSSTCMFVTVGLNFAPPPLLGFSLQLFKIQIFNRREKSSKMWTFGGGGKVIQIMDRENIVHEELRRGET